MLAGFVNVGSLGPKIYLLAHEKSNGAVEPVVTYALPADMFIDGPCGCYCGSFLTKKGSGLTTFESTRGKVSALVNPGVHSIAYGIPIPLVSREGRIWIRGIRKCARRLHTGYQVPGQRIVRLCSMAAYCMASARRCSCAIQDLPPTSKRPARGLARPRSRPA